MTSRAGEAPVISAPAAPEAGDLIRAALAEDFGVPVAWLEPGAGLDLLSRDVTGSLLPEDAVFPGTVVARTAGVLCGLPVFRQVYDALCESTGAAPVEIVALETEGARVEAGTAVLRLDGPARVVLAGERTALDFLIVLSGIATRAAVWQEAAGPSMSVCDTRKTVPGLRELSKYAVRVGGGTNHRHGLYDMVLVKDNHISALGGIAAAVASARASHPGLPIEVEADSVAQAAEAAASGADMVLLDNMGDVELAAAVAAVRAATPPGGRCLTEASGGITMERLPALAALGLDRVSTSRLTMAPPLDFALDERTRS